MVAAKKIEFEDFLALVPEAKKRLKEGTKRRANASCISIYGDGEFSTVKNHVCHAFLDGIQGEILVNGLQTGEDYSNNPGRILPKKVELWFVDYMLNRSPYNQIFLEKDAVKALEEQMVVVNGNHPGNMVGAGLVALRRLWEYVYVAHSAYDLVQHGVNEDLAFFLGHMIQVGNDITPKAPACWAGCTNGHSSINPGIMGYKELKNFITHNPVKASPDLYSQGDTYRHYDGMYGSVAVLGLSCRRGIQELYEEVLKGEDVVGKSTTSSNPFQASVKKEQEALGAAPNKLTQPYAKAIEVMAKVAKDHLMEKINNA